MANHSFDRLARAVVGRSRRRLLGALAGGALGALDAVAGLGPTAARKPGKRRKKGHDRDQRAACPTCPAPPVAATCPGACPSECDSCKTRVGAPPLCTGGSYSHGCQPCSSDNDCIDFDPRYPYCVRRNYGSSQITTICEICGTCEQGPGVCLTVAKC